MTTETANHTLALARETFARGDYIATLSHASVCLVAQPASVEARALRVNALLKLERWTVAISDLEWLIRTAPQQNQYRRLLALCWLRIGNMHKEQKDINAAIAAYQTAMHAAPDQQDARYNLGLLLLELGKAAEALPLLENVIASEPDNHTAALKLAQAQTATGAQSVASKTLLQIAARSTDHSVLERCAELLLQTDREQDAIELALRIAQTELRQWSWVWQFAATLRTGGNLADSRRLLHVLHELHTDPAVRLRIDLADALGLPAVYASRQEQETVRGEFLHGLQRLITGYPPERITAIAPDPGMLCWENFHLAYQGENDLDPQRQYGQWLTQALAARLPELNAPLYAPSRPRARLVMLSGRFHECTVGVYFASWVEYLAQHGWELILAHLGSYRDQLTEHLSQCAHSNITLDGSFTDNAQRVRALDADMLLYPELGMDATAFALAGLRLAPLQVCAWGHPATTGLPTIDAFISCAEMEPDNAQQHYSERLLMLPGLGTRYRSPAIPEPVSRHALGLPPDRTLYLVPQSPFKLHPDNDSLLVDIIHKDANALIVLFDGVETRASHRLHQRLAHSLADAGLRPEQHLHFLQQCPRAHYLRINQVCDVMVDSLHWSGGNTTLDALHCGLPVVTCPGQFMRGRQSMAMLRQIGCAELIATSAAQLAEIAVDLAHNRNHRNAISAQIRARLPQLTQSDEPLHALDTLLRTLLATA